MKLEYLMEYSGRLQSPVAEVGVGPFGNRTIYTVAYGSFEGPRLKGKLLPGGSDAALENAIRLGASQVKILSDSELVVRQINGQYRVKTVSLKPLYQKIKQLQSQLQGFTITHMPGQENTEAHNLANAALK